MGYFGETIYRTNCLVLMREPFSQSQIRSFLDQLCRLNPVYADEPSMAVSIPGFPWLGIDCGSLQQSVHPDIVEKAARITGSTVLLYDEFEGDILTLGYGNPQTGVFYCRYGASCLEALEEFGYENDGDFPDELLEFMDCSAEEAKAVWFSDEFTFEIEKMDALAALMTKAPVPGIFIGKYDLKAIPENASVTRYEAQSRTDSGGMDERTSFLKHLLPNLVKGMVTKHRDRRKEKGYQIDLPSSVWKEGKPPIENSKIMRQDIFSAEFGTIYIKCISNPFSLDLSDISKRWDQTPQQYEAENVRNGRILSYKKEDTPDSVIKEYEILHDNGESLFYRYGMDIAKADESYMLEMRLNTDDPDVISEYKKYAKSFRLD